MKAILAIHPYPPIELFFVVFFVLKLNCHVYFFFNFLFVCFLFFFSFDTIHAS